MKNTDLTYAEALGRMFDGDKIRHSAWPPDQFIMVRTIESKKAVYYQTSQKFVGWATYLNVDGHWEIYNCDEHRVKILEAEIKNVQDRINLLQDGISDKMNRIRDIKESMALSNAHEILDNMHESLSRGITGTIGNP